MTYDIQCRFCSARFTPHEWQHHSPDCPYVAVADPAETGGES